MRNPLSRGSRKTRSSSRAKAAGPLSKKWHQSRPLRAAVGAVALAVPIAVVASSNASAGVNLVVNPGFSQSGSGFPACWTKSVTGTNSASFSMTSKAYSGSAAVQLSVSSYTSGEALAMITENQACAPAVTAGHQYSLGVHYMSSTPNAVIEVYRHDVKTGWSLWMDLKNLPAAGTYQDASVRTPTIPAGTNQISFGVALYGTGTLITDNYSMVDATVAASAVKCTAGVACSKGVWQVLPFPSPVRSIHTVLMYNGKVLFVAGSGNDPNEFAAGTFESAVYDPTTGKFQVIPTPDDFFCAGHVQLADGNVLVLGGNKAYQVAASGTNPGHNYFGLNTSYIFDPVTDKYVKENNLNQGHWYPSATELGNGNIISYGGLNEVGQAATDIEYFKYDKPPTDSKPGQRDRRRVAARGRHQRRQPGQHQLHRLLGPVPGDDPDAEGRAVLHRQPRVRQQRDPRGRGGHPPGPGRRRVPQHRRHHQARPRDRPDHPGQGTAGHPRRPGRHRHDRPVDVGAAAACADTAGVPGWRREHQLPESGHPAHRPDQPQHGRPRLQGRAAAAEGHPLERPGGAGRRRQDVRLDGAAAERERLRDRRGPDQPGGPGLRGVHDQHAGLEEGDPASQVYTEMAADPVPRTYHSQSFLLPDGRIISIGNNPGDGSFNMQISVYSPPYLFDGARPVIKSVASETNWTYGHAYKITTSTPIKSAELIRPAAVTHQSDPNQRYVALPISGTGDTVSLNLNSNDNIAPPGWYMLFVTNGNNVPSVAKWVHVG